MDLIPTDTQAMLVEAALSFTARECPPARVREVTASSDGFDAGLWSAMGELGWCGLMVDEAHGGAGQGVVELVMLCEALGHGPVPSPLIASTTAALALALTGTAQQRERWLPALSSGAAVATFAHVAPDAGDQGSSTPGRVTGKWLLVPWAANADVIVVCTTAGLRLVDPAQDGVTCSRHDDLRVDPLYAVELDDAGAEPLGDDEPDGHAPTVRRILDVAAVAHLAAAVGAGEGALQLTLGHARQRHQFGRPIGSFQAVAHRCVDMRTELDACRFLAYRAAWSLDRAAQSLERVAQSVDEATHEPDVDSCADLEVGGALAYGTEALRAVLGHAHQVHGAFGFSTESDLHLYTRAAKAFELGYGGSARNLERVATGMGLR